MTRPLLTFVIVASTALAAAAAQAQPAATVISPKARNVPHADPLGPRFSSGTVAESVARAKIEKDGYTGVRSLIRTGDGGWQGVARGHDNKPVVVSLDGKGTLNEVR